MKWWQGDWEVLGMELSRTGRGWWDWRASWGGWVLTVRGSREAVGRDARREGQTDPVDLGDAREGRYQENEGRAQGVTGGLRELGGREPSRVCGMRLTRGLRHWTLEASFWDTEK